VNNKYLGPILIIAIIASFGAGLYIGESGKSSVEKINLATNQELGRPAAVDFSLFWDVWNRVENEYVERLKLAPQKMIYGAISGMLRSLDDPYTLFLPPEESKKFQDDMRGDFEGIGAEIGLRKDILTIISPIEGAPAQKAGLQPQDMILKINDTSTDNLNLDEAVNMIRGSKGTSVRLLVMRESWKEPKEIEIVRDKINIPVIKAEMKDSNMAYIRLYQFTENSPDEFDKAAKQILKSKPKGIVLDLRNNPGGYLEAAVDIAGWFLKSGEVVAIEEFGSGQKTEYRSRGDGELGNMPIIVLVNKGSASASEILAGALRDDKQIKLVGEKTFGKGSVQQLDNLSGGASLKITVAKWLTPSGQSIMNNGLEPDIRVEISDDDVNNGRDPQLDRAIELLK
jgi:carboxyl-terminal processing protease